MRRAVLVTLIVLGSLALGVAGVLLSSSPGLAPADGGDVTTDTPAPDAPTPTPPAGTAGENLTVHFLDVGQGDAAVLSFPNGETMLVDSGDWRDDGTAVLAALDRLGVDRLDHLVTTHGHADHIGGHAAVIDRFERSRSGVGAVYDPGVAHTTATYERYLDAVERHDLDLFEVRAGDELGAGAATVRFLNPPAEREPDDLDDDGAVLLVEYGSVGFLFTGDAGADAEARMRAAHDGLSNATVYQAGHHGSNTSSTGPFLDAVEPRIAVVSSARESQYGHPHDEVLERFVERGYETYWTGVHGDVVVSTDGRATTVTTERDAPTNAAELRGLKRDGERPDAVARPGDFAPGAPTP